MSGKIGSYDNYGNISRYVSNAERRIKTIDDNISDVNVIRGPEASANYLGVLENFSTGEGWIADDKLYRFSSVDNAINVGDIAELSSVDRFGFGLWSTHISSTGFEQIMRKQLNTSTRIFAYTNGTSLFFGLQSSTLQYAELPNYTNFMPLGKKTYMYWRYRGFEALNDDRITLHINGVEMVLNFTANIPTSTPNMTGSDLIIGAGYGLPSTISDISGWSFDAIDRDDTWIENDFQLGDSLWGLVGVENDTPNGVINLIDNRIGLYNPYNEVFSFIGSASTLKVNTYSGLLPISNGEASGGVINATFNNFGVNEGFIPENGGVPAHILFPSGDKYISLDGLDLRGKTEFTINVKLSFDSLSGVDGLFYQEYVGVDTYVALYRSSGALILVLRGALAYESSWDISALSISTFYDLSIQYIAGEKPSLSIDSEPFVLGSLIIDESLPTGDIVQTLLGSIDTPGFEFDGKIQKFVIRDNAVSSDFVKNLYYASTEDQSENEINYGGITGKETETAGVIEYDCKYQAFSAQMVWLEVFQDGVIQHGWNTGRVGNDNRGDIDYTVHEFLMRYDLAVLSGKKISSLRMLLYGDDDFGGGGTLADLFEQNKTSLVGVEDPLKYDDFAYTPWDSELVGSIVLNEGTNEVSSSESLKSHIQAILDGSESQDNGMIIGSPAAPTVNFFGVELLIEISDADSYLHYVGRGIRAGLGVGIC